MPVPDSQRLREIAFAAKAHWGYDERLVREWVDALAFPPEERVLVEDGGWAGVVVRGDVCRLEDLWVEPAAMGRGVGRRRYLRDSDVTEWGRVLPIMGVSLVE